MKKADPLLLKASHLMRCHLIKAEILIRNLSKAETNHDNCPPFFTPFPPCQSPALFPNRGNPTPPVDVRRTLLVRQLLLTRGLWSLSVLE